MGTISLSTSGNITFNQTRDQLIADALQLIGYLAAGETANANDITFCAGMLNKMVKAWMGQGIHLWTEEEGTIYLVNGQAQYSLQVGAGGANASDGTGTPVETTLGAVGSGSTITVVSSTGMTAGDVIGVQLDAVGTAASAIQWTTISSVTNATTVVLNATLTSSASKGNQVFSYTTQMPRVLSIQAARCRDTGNFDRIMKVLPRQDYEKIPQKALTGQPIILFFSPQLTQDLVYVWPTPSDVGQRLKVTYLREIQDFTSSGDNPDMPQEWLEAITYNLAVRIAPAYGINLSAGGISGNPGLVTQAAEYLEEMKAWDTEQPFVQFVPGWDYK